MTLLTGLMLMMLLMMFQMTLTGLMVMMFSKTSNRKSVLVKVCGCSCLLSALLCVVVTVTTTVVHMNRLQTLRECVYQVRNTLIWMIMTMCIRVAGYLALT